MAVEKPRSGGDVLATVERWPRTFDELHTRVARRFLRPEVRQRARRYLGGLLGRVERKNGWQMAEQMGEVGPQGAQRLLNSARWDADAVRDDLREHVIEHLGEEESGVPIVDETGLLKKGEKSVGVARQYTGTAGRIENAQVGVFLAYASEKGAAFVDRALYLPREEWAEDHLRREEAGVPDEVRFATKGELAKGMLRRAFEAKVPARWVVADTIYGTARGLRGWLEEQGRSYVLAVPATKGIYFEGRQRQTRSLAKDLPKKRGLGNRPVRAAREKGSTTGPSCPGPSCRSPSPKHPAEGAAGCSCVGASVIRPNSPTTWPTDRRGRPPRN